MDTDCIADYVAAVTHERHEERVLHFDVQVEANIFRTIPHNLQKQFGKLKIPGFLLSGKDSEVCMPKQINKFIKGNPSVSHQTLAFGGHMFPLEKPIDVAKEINQILLELSLD
jgi:pimeloyl-ACP methyl ester carboxylesterase